MTTPEQELTEALASACLRARDRGMRYDAILSALRTMDARLRVAHRAAEHIHATRHDRAQHAAIKPMRRLVETIMQTQSPAQQAG